MLTRTHKLTTLALLAAAVAVTALGRPAVGGRVDFSAEFNTVRVDLSMSPGKKYKLIAKVENKGAKAWLPAEVQLVGRWTTGPGAPNGRDDLGFETKVPRVVSSNFIVDIPGEMTGPSMPGDWTFTLRMEHRGKPFGKPITQKIEVEDDFDGEVTDIDLPKIVKVGRRTGGKLVVKNTGLSDWDAKRIVVRGLAVNNRTRGNAQDFFEKEKIGEFKLGKNIPVGGSLPVLFSVYAQTSGQYTVKMQLWDLDDRDEIGRPKTLEVEVQ